MQSSPSHISSVKLKTSKGMTLTTFSETYYNFFFLNNKKLNGMAINTWPGLKNVQYLNLEFRYNNEFHCVARGLVSAVDNFFHICVGLFCYISRRGTKWDWGLLYTSFITFKCCSITEAFNQKTNHLSQTLLTEINKNFPLVFTFKKNSKN